MSDSKPCQLTAESHPVTERWCLAHNQTQPECRIRALVAELEAAWKRVAELEAATELSTLTHEERRLFAWHPHSAVGALRQIATEKQVADLSEALRLERERAVAQSRRADNAIVDMARRWARPEFGLFIADIRAAVARALSDPPHEESKT